MVGGRWAISKTAARDALHRAGYPQDRIDEILSGLPDPFDANEAADHLAHLLGGRHVRPAQALARDLLGEVEALADPAGVGSRVRVPAAEAAWLDPEVDLDAALELVRPLPDGLLDVYPLSPRINSSRVEGIELHTPLHG